MNPISKLTKIFNLSFLIVFLGMYIGNLIGSLAASIFISLTLAIAAVIVYWKGKKVEKLKIYNPVLNSLAIGFSVGMYYLKNKITMNVSHAFLVYFSAIILLNVMNYVAENISHRKILTCVNILLGAAAIVISLLCWHKNLLFSQILFAAIIYASFMIWQLIILGNPSSIWLCISIVYFIIFAFIFLVIITEGEALGALDADFGGDGRKRRK